tara:strand:+ start:8480 stop:9565 length:1086 start_codon:yes stop_codon:yes gene_type:complete
MADPIDFNQGISRERDITPMQNRFFSEDSTYPMLSGGGKDLNWHLRYQKSVLMPLQEDILKTQKSIMELDQARMAQKKGRQERRMQREMTKSIPLIKDRMSEIDRIVDPNDKKSAFNDLQLEFANSITKSPVISNIFQIKNKGISDQISSDEKEKSKMSGARNSFAQIYLNATMNSRDPQNKFDVDTYNAIKFGDAPLSDYQDIVQKSVQMSDSAKARASSYDDFKDLQEAELELSLIPHQKAESLLKGVSTDPESLDNSEPEGAANMDRILRAYLLAHGIQDTDDNREKVKVKFDTYADIAKATRQKSSLAFQQVNLAKLKNLEIERERLIKSTGISVANPIKNSSPSSKMNYSSSDPEE